MKNAAAKGGKLFFLAAAFALCAALLAAPAAEATRTLPALAEPAQATPRATLEVLEDATPDPHRNAEKRLRLFEDLSWPTHPLELVQISKTASGVFDLGLNCNILEKGGLSQECGSPSFQGLWHDPTTGLAYARNRWYDARTASWLSEDPLGPVDSPNLYAFVAWGPHLGTDPMGDRVRDEHLFDPNTEFYEVNGKRYQLAKSGVVYRFGFFDHSYEDDPEIVAAVRAIAGFCYGGDNNGLQGLAREVNSRVTEEQVYAAMAVTWAPYAIVTAPYAAGSAYGSLQSGTLWLAARAPWLVSTARFIGEQVIDEVSPGGTVSGAASFMDEGVDAVRRVGDDLVEAPLRGVWTLNMFERGRAIEQAVTKEYQAQGWFALDDLTRAKNWPLVDFQKGNTLVSLKSVDTRGKTWITRMEAHIEDLGTRGAAIDGNPANMVLDLRVQPGGSAAAQSLVDFGTQYGVTVRILEFP